MRILNERVLQSKLLRQRAFPSLRSLSHLPLTLNAQKASRVETKKKVFFSIVELVERAIAADFFLSLSFLESL